MDNSFEEISQIMREFAVGMRELKEAQARTDAQLAKTIKNWMKAVCN